MCTVLSLQQRVGAHRDGVDAPGVAQGAPAGMYLIPFTFQKTCSGESPAFGRCRSGTALSRDMFDGDAPLQAWRQRLRSGVSGQGERCAITSSATAMTGTGQQTRIT
jgi:hypothetical protein